MPEKEMKLVDFASVELLAAHYVRIIKWLVVALIVTICLFFSYVCIQYAFSAEVVETQEIVADQDGYGTNLIGGGDVFYGTESHNP